MRRSQIDWKATTIWCVLIGMQLPCYALDSASFELAGGNKTKMARIGAQWNWGRQWWQSNGSYIGGHWDVSLAQWRGNQYRNVPGATQSITDIGVTPVLRFQRDDKTGFYGEAGIGMHFLSDLYNNNGRQLSTHFQLGNHLGIGYVFKNNVDVGLRFQHYSNAGIKNPNSGVNFTIVRAGYQF